MKGLFYQLKSVWKDKFCIMSFLLPVVVALALNFVGSIDLSSLGEFQFGVIAHRVPSETKNWLERYGSVTVYQTKDEWITAIKEPSTNLISLFVGRISGGLMVGIVYIKIVMIVFMAVPILYYLAETENKILAYICYLVPSSATFEGIMDLANGGTSIIGKDIAILAAHCVVWFLLYLPIIRWM